MCARSVVFSLFVFALLTLPAPGLAQGSVTIFGTVTDSSGAVVPGATLVVTHLETRVFRETISSSAGTYVVSQLAIGTYSVRAELSGFKTFLQENVRVQVGDNRQVNVVLQVGAPSESVSVSTDVSQVETRSGSLREVVDSQRIVDLPLNGRNPLQLQYLVAAAAQRPTRRRTNRCRSMAHGQTPTTTLSTEATTTIPTSTLRRSFHRPTRWRSSRSRPMRTAPTRAGTRAPS